MPANDTSARAPEGVDALEAATRAFDDGDFRRVRELAGPLAVSDDRALASAAQELIRRTELDPIHVAVLVACLVLVGIITYVYAIL